MEHTKMKLCISKMYDDGSIHIYGGDSKEYICSVQIKQIGGGATAGAMESRRKANAEHLVKCWNSHDKLLEALGSIMKKADTAVRQPTDGAKHRTTLNEIGIMADAAIAAGTERK